MKTKEKKQVELRHGMSKREFLKLEKRIIKKTKKYGKANLLDLFKALAYIENIPKEEIESISDEEAIRFLSSLPEQEYQQIKDLIKMQ